MKKTASKKSVSTTHKIKNTLRKKAETLIEEIENVFSGQPRNIEAALKIDHDGLRNFLKLLKDTKAPMTERKRAYSSFSALLKSHSDAEEKVVYATSDLLSGHELHIKIAEGFVEHQLANDLMKRIEKAKDPVEWSAHANVISEIVEHHLKEEERDLFPLIRKKAPAGLDKKMLTQFLALRQKSQKRRTPKNSGVLKKVKS